MSEESTNEIPFVPKLPLPHADRLKSFARSVQRLAVYPVNSPAWSQKLNQLRTEACEHGQALPLNELKLMVAKNLLLDLATQGWRVAIRGGSILLISQYEANGEIAKEVIRNRHLQERNAQLRESSVVTFQPNTQPLYRCYSDSEHSHFAANDENCNNMGKREALLGYDLKQ
jgi:hypothetical protein